MAEPTARRGARHISIFRHPLYSMFLPVPIVCFSGALITDLAYQWSGGTLLYANMSSWLIAAGLLFGGIALILLWIDAVRSAIGWLTFAVLLAAWVVEFINSLIHARDGWSAVVPIGLVLSIVGALLALLAGWFSRSAVEVLP